MRAAVRIVAINLVVLAGLFALVELGDRAYGVILRDRPFFRENRFRSPWFTTYDDPSPRIAADGRAQFRHREHFTALRKPPRTLRIVALGGSTTVCEAAYRESGRDWPLALEARLNAESEGPTYEVLNAASDAYSSAHSLVNFVLRVVEYDPDVVLVLHNVNDATVNFFGSGATADYGNKYLRPYFVNPQLQAGLSLAGLLNQSSFLSRRGLALRLAGARDDLRTDNDPRYGMRLFRRNLETLAAVCRLRGIKLVLLTQPVTTEFGEDDTLRLHDEYNRLLAEVAREQGATLIDLFARLGGDRRYFVDAVHYSAAGVERFAELLAPDLSAVVLDQYPIHVY